MTQLVLLYTTKKVYMYSKKKGELLIFVNAVDGDVEAHIGIGHTRWATHGVPSKLNAHPHQI